MSRQQASNSETADLTVASGLKRLPFRLSRIAVKDVFMVAMLLRHPHEAQ
jgi:hypothetical protein